MGEETVRRRVDCVGGLVVTPDGRILLVRRGNEPAKGCWSVPGGRVEPGEEDATATAREVLEETGLAVEVRELAGTVERDAPDGSVFVIRDYRCVPADGADTAAVVAGDDAADVGWFTPDEVQRLECAPGLVETFVEWGVLPLGAHGLGVPAQDDPGLALMPEHGDGRGVEPEEPPLPHR